MNFLILNNIFKAKNFFFTNFDFRKRCKNQIEVNDDKIYSRFNYTVSHENDFTAYDLHRDHPKAWESKIELWQKMDLIQGDRKKLHVEISKNNTSKFLKKKMFT